MSEIVKVKISELVAAGSVANTLEGIFMPGQDAEGNKLAVPGTLIIENITSALGDVATVLDAINGEVI